MCEQLLQQLKALWLARRRDVHAKHQRSLPVAEYLVGRCEKARELGFDESTSAYNSVLALGDMQVGRNTCIRPFVVLDGSGGLTIGSNCSISAGVQVYSHDSVAWAVSGGTAAYQRAPSAIGDNCYIGPDTVVARGARIGEGCIVGAHSRVLDDIPPRSKAYGSPCRVAGPVTPDDLAGIA